jgi:hypothetical protein
MKIKIQFTQNNLNNNNNNNKMTNNKYHKEVGKIIVTNSKINNSYLLIIKVS